MGDPSQRKLVVIVPFLNEAENLPLLYERICAALVGQPEALEVLFVDDGSSDGSAAWVAARAASDPCVKLLRLSRNFGHQLAITAGMDHAGGDAVVIMDADLQDPPEVIPELLRRWREGHEIVYAVRSSRSGESWAKRFLAATFYKTFRRMANVDVPLDAGDFRLVDRKVIEALKQVRELHRFVRGLTCWVGFSQAAVHYERAPRHAGVTKYPVWKSTRLAWDAITSFSSTPLRWMTVIGLLVSLAGLLQAVRVVVDRLLYPGTMERGWASLAAITLFLGGVQLISLGLIGQYVGRIFEESKKRPLYFVKERVGLAEPTAGGDRETVARAVGTGESRPTSGLSASREPGSRDRAGAAPRELSQPLDDPGAVGSVERGLQRDEGQ